MRGQLSAEMLVVLVVILGLAVLLASVMMKSANKAAEKVENAANTTLSKAGGRYCADDSYCDEGQRCDTQSRLCTG